jgi:hypothetical protein
MDTVVRDRKGEPQHMLEQILCVHRIVNRGLKHICLHLATKNPINTT